MKKPRLLLLTGIAVFLLSACGATNKGNEAGSKESWETAGPPVREVALTEGSVTVYDYGKMKLHTYTTGDSLNNEAYIVEGANRLVGIELPCFTAGLDEWKTYVAELGKPMNDLFLCEHATGAGYVEEMTIYGTQGAKDAIEGGATFAEMQRLYGTFGGDFHGGPDVAHINTVVPEGKVTVADVEFNLIDHGDTYDLEIPALNVVYTHMAGDSGHSSMAQTDRETLNEYSYAGYDMILSAHSEPEGTEKISYGE